MILLRILYSHDQVPDAWIHYVDYGKNEGKLWLGPQGPNIGPYPQNADAASNGRTPERRELELIMDGNGA